MNEIMKNENKSFQKRKQKNKGNKKMKQFVS